MRISLHARLAAATAAALTIAAGVAVADEPPPSGPVYPPPGGVLLASSGDPGRAGGVTFTYTELETERFSPLWWGVHSESLPGIAMDGEIDEPGEQLTWSEAQSDLAAGVAVFTGSAELPGFGNFPTRATVRTQTLAGEPLPMTSAAGAGLPAAIGGVAVIGDDFRSNFILEVNGVPAADFFDDARTNPDQEGQLRTSVAGGFYFVPANVLPEASFGWTPETPTAGRTVEFSSTSTDADGTITATAWDLDGDGEYDDAAGDTASHVFSEAGDQTVGVQVTDDRGGVDTATATVTVVPNELPTVSFSWSPQSPRALQTVTFTASSADSDGTVVETTWDLDDDGEYDDATGNTASKAFAEAGAHAVSVRVVDDLGGVATHTEVVTVSSCENTAVTQTLRTLGAALGIEPQVRSINCEVLTPLGL